MKCAWRCGGGPARLCQFDNPRSRPDPQAHSARGGMTAVYTGRELLSGTGEVGGFFSGERLESSQLCSGSVRPRPGSPPGVLGPKGWVQDAPVGKVPHSLCVRGQGVASQLSVFQNTLPSHGFQTGPALQLCWKYLGRFFSPGEDFIPWGLGVQEGQEDPGKPTDPLPP